MDVKIITVEDFEKLKIELINAVREELAKAKVGGGGVVADEYLTSKEVRAILHISSRQWQKLRDQRRIPFSQIGRKIYVKRSDLNAFLASNRIRPRNEY